LLKGYFRNQTKANSPPTENSIVLYPWFNECDYRHK